MGRLIDADALLQEIESLTVHITGLRSGKGALFNFMNEYRKTILRIIDEQPTVYDPEKVKKEIDRVGKSFCDYVACNEECTSCEHHSIMNAVTCIVRKGGVS